MKDYTSTRTAQILAISKESIFENISEILSFIQKIMF